MFLCNNYVIRKRLVDINNTQTVTSKWQTEQEASPHQMCRDCPCHAVLKQTPASSEVEVSKNPMIKATIC